MEEAEASSVETIAAFAIPRGKVLSEQVTFSAAVLGSRPAGTLAFLDVGPVGGGKARIQLAASKSYCGEEALALVRSIIEVGDLLSCVGQPGRTRTGACSDVTVFLSSVTLTKVVSPTPSRIVTLLSHAMFGVGRRNTPLWSLQEAGSALGMDESTVQALSKLLQPQLDRRRRDVKAALNSATLKLSTVPSPFKVPNSARLARLQRLVSLRQRLVVVLEDCANPGNASAALRCADAFGVQEVLLVAAENPPLDLSAQLRSSASACRWVKMRHFLGAESALAHLHKEGFAVVVTSPHTGERKCCELHGERWALAPRTALWFGNEARGVSEMARNAADKLLYIEMNGMVESLNLAVSAGVVLSEATRQRRAHWQDDYGFTAEEQDALLRELIHELHSVERS